MGEIIRVYGEILFDVCYLIVILVTETVPEMGTYDT